MSEIIEEFAGSYFVTENLTDERCRSIRRELTAFEAFIDKPLLEGTDLDLDRFLALRLQTLVPTTVQKIQYQVRPFYKWAWRRQLIPDEQWRRIQDLPCPRGGSPSTHRPNPYSPEHMTRLWALLDRRYPRTDQHWVDRWIAGKSPWARVRRHGERLQYEAIIACALYGGMRKAEIYRLDLDALHSDHASLPARSRKNREGVWKERKVPIIEPMHVAFAEWYEFRTALENGVVQIPQPISVPETRPFLRLHRTDFGFDLHEGRHEGHGSQHLLRLGKDGQVWWKLQRLRHTCATEMLRAGYQLHIVQRILGHSSMHQTLKYAELLEGDVLAESERVGGRFAAAIDRRRNGHGA